jgi:hypothetical protein
MPRRKILSARVGDSPLQPPIGQRQRPGQNEARSENWICREAPALKICPTVELVSVEDGKASGGVFKELKNSVRNCNCALSRKRNVLRREKSTFTRPGVLNVLRPRLPKQTSGFDSVLNTDWLRQSGALVKAVGLNHLSAVWLPGLD